MSGKDIGRNDPCPCGSGKKFKKCCLDRQNRLEREDPKESPMSGEVPEIPDPFWRDIRRAIAPLAEDLLRFAESRFGSVILEMAWSDFLMEDELGESGPDPFHFPVFFSWFFFKWIPDPYSETYDPPSELAEETISHLFLKKHRKTLHPLVIRYIEACQKSVFTFYDVLSVRPGTGMRLRDILTETTFDVRDRSASETLRPGEILFGNAVRIDSLDLLDSSAAYLIPISRKPEILALRKFVRKMYPNPVPSDLDEYDIEIFDLYHDLMEDLRNPAPLVMNNTDGERVVLHEIVYDVPSTREAFEALKTLALDNTEEDLLENAEFDGEGNLSKVLIPWLKPGNPIHASWDNTLLGDLGIQGTTLTVRTNSDERAEAIRKIVEERLPASCLRSDTTTSQETLREEALRRKANPVEAEPMSSPATTPEMQEALKDLIAREYRDWPHVRIPMLGDRTPLEAVSDPDGRELVESLLFDIEHRESGPGLRIDPRVVDEIRRTLGLPRQVFEPEEGL